MSEIINSIICADVLDGLKRIPDGIVTLVVNSPPYNVGEAINYDNRDDDQPYREYIEWLANVYRECKRTLRVGGRLIVNIDAMTNRQEDKQDEYVRPVYADLVNVLKPMGYKFFGEHTWYKSTNFPFSGTCPKCYKKISVNTAQWTGRKTAWGSYKNPSFPVVRRCHEYILVFSNEEFRLEKSPESGDPDITGEEFQEYIGSVWAMNAETQNLGGHPVPYPLELPIRCCKLYSFPNDIILDPFVGTGTTALAAKMTGRRYIGIDNSPVYCKFAEERIEASRNIFADDNN